MKCRKCGNDLPIGVAVCGICGTEADNYEQIMEENVERFGLDKCPKCGYVGEAVPEKILRKRDWLIFVVSLFFGGFGLIYLPVTYFIRCDVSKRNKVCPSCKAVIHKKKKGGLFPDKDSVNRAKNVATTLANDPNFKKNLRDLKRSTRDFHDSLNP